MGARSVLAKIGLDSFVYAHKLLGIFSKVASVAQLVEHHLAKVDVESSSLFARSIVKESKTIVCRLLCLKLF